MAGYKNRKVIRIATVVSIMAAVAIVVLAGIGLSRGSGLADVFNRESAQKSSEQTEKQEYVKHRMKPAAELMFASDYQQMLKDPAQNLASIMKSISAGGCNIDNLIFCGDYTAAPGTNDYNGNPDGTVASIKSMVHKAFPLTSTGDMIFVQGNHDSGSDSLSKDGLHEFDEYLVYVMNTETSNPNHQEIDNEEETVKASAAALSATLVALEKKGETRPVIIATHVPLHFSDRTANTKGDNVYSRYIFDVLNSVGNKLDIIYVFGHNHSDSYDNYLGASSVYRPAGSKVLIPEGHGSDNTSDFTEETLRFTYMNAGYVGYADEAMSHRTMTCTVMKIYSDRIEVERYSAGGRVPLGEKGARGGSLVGDKYSVEEVDSSEITRLAR